MMGFEQCHPAVNLIYFAAVLSGAIAFRHPVFLGISYLCAFAYSVKRNRARAVMFDLALIPAAVIYALYYGSCHHFGLTDLGMRAFGNRLTLESMVYGLVLGFVVAAVLMWFSCMHSVFTTDKVTYLFGAVSPRLSLYLAILLRLAPRIRREAGRINKARQGIGRGVNQGNLLRRLGNGVRIFSALISWTIGALATVTVSMRARGGALKGRTAFSIYRFDNRDRACVIGLFALLTATGMGCLLRQTHMVYDPRLLWPGVTAMSYIFYVAYAALCLMPMGLELWTEWNFQRARRKLFKQTPPRRGQ